MNHLILLPMSTEIQAQPAGWYADPAGQARYRYWDGRGWTHQTSHAKDPVNGRALGPGFARLGDWLAHLLRLSAVLALVQAACYLWLWQETRSSRSTAGSTLRVVDTVQVVSVVVLVVTGIVWFVWQVRLLRSAPGGDHRGAGWQVAGWLVPFATFYVPFQNISRLWRSYGAGRDEPVAEASPVLLPAWWGTWIAANVVTWFAYLQAFSDAMRAARSGTPLDVYDVYGHVSLWYAGHSAVMFLAAVLAIRVVTRLSWRALVFWTTD